jgi:hypothetical protein
MTRAPRLKPGRKPDARAVHRREALRFCCAGIDEGWSPERTSELCITLYGVEVPPAVIRDLFNVIKKTADIRAIDDSMVS